LLLKGEGTSTRKRKVLTTLMLGIRLTPEENKDTSPESTLAKTAAQLKSKKLDLEFSIDPLFRKTCADFDEGGAHGLLMNHLSIGVGIEGGLRVIFDAGDSLGRDDDDEDIQEPEDDVDLTFLRSELFIVLRIL